jgi:hypothetical protein
MSCIVREIKRFSSGAFLFSHRFFWSVDARWLIDAFCVVVFVVWCDCGRKYKVISSYNVPVANHSRSLYCTGLLTMQLPEALWTSAFWAIWNFATSNASPRQEVSVSLIWVRHVVKRFELWWFCGPFMSLKKSSSLWDKILGFRAVPACSLPIVPSTHWWNSCQNPTIV